MAKGSLAAGASTSTGGDIPVFTDPTSAVIPTGPDTRFRRNVVALTTRNRQAGLTIRPKRRSLTGWKKEWMTRWRWKG